MADEQKVPLIRNKYQPSEKEHRLLRMVYERKRAMEDGSDRREASKNWDKWMQQWESLRQPKDPDDWQSNHVVPLTTGVIESALADIIDQSPNPIIMARGAEDVPKATIMRHIFNYTWEVSDGDVSLYDIVKDALILGTGIGQEYYCKIKRKVKKLEKDGDGVREDEDEITEYDDCMLEPVRLQDFFVDENSRGFTGPYTARDCIRRYVMSWDDFKNYYRGDIWDPSDKAKYVEPGGDTEYYEYYHPPQGIDHSKQVEVLWYWSRLPEDLLVIVANDVVIKHSPNPYKHKQLPFAKMVDVKRPHRFYGKGECELLESVQNEKDTIHRMIIDRNHLDIDKMFLVGNRAQLAEEDLVARPHGLIPVDDPSMVKAIEYGDVPRSVEMSDKALSEDGVVATGIDPRFTSAPQAGTATEAAILKESALRRIRMKIRILEREFLVRVARLRVANIIQFYSQPKMEAIVGDKASSRFKNELERLRAQGLLVERGGQTMVKRYREIRLENKEIDYDQKGTPVEKPIRGYSFFEAKPESFVPVASGGYDIKFAAGATLPISKPLMQTKSQEVYDRLIANPGYDPVKLGDKLLLEPADFDPDDLHLEQAPEEEEDVSSQQQITLAMEENKRMAAGETIPATEMAAPAHTRIHIEFMKSEQVPQGDNPVVKIFTHHIIGEILSQQQRKDAGIGMGMSMEQPGNMGTQSNSPLTAVQSGESARRAVTPGKAPGFKREMKLGEVMPGRVTGSRTVPFQA